MRRASGALRGDIVDTLPSVTNCGQLVLATARTVSSPPVASCSHIGFWLLGCGRRPAQSAWQLVYVYDSPLSAATRSRRRMMGESALCQLTDTA